MPVVRLHRRVRGTWNQMSMHSGPVVAAHGAHNPPVLDLFGEDGWRRVYAGELEARPPGAPTTQARFDGSDSVGRLVNTRRQGRKESLRPSTGSIMSAESLPLECRPPSLAPRCPASRPYSAQGGRWRVHARESSAQSVRPRPTCRRLLSEPGMRCRHSARREHCAELRREGPRPYHAAG